jgi:hypothetical protein
MYTADYQEYISHPYIIRFHLEIFLGGKKQEIVLCLSIDGNGFNTVVDEDDATDFKTISEARNLVRLLDISNDAHIFDKVNQKIVD